MEQSTIDCMLLIAAYIGLFLQYILINVCKNTYKLLKRKKQGGK